MTATRINSEDMEENIEGILDMDDYIHEGLDQIVPHELQLVDFGKMTFEVYCFHMPNMGPDGYEKVHIMVPELNGTPFIMYWAWIDGGHAVPRIYEDCDDDCCISTCNEDIRQTKIEAIVNHFRYQVSKEHPFYWGL